MPAPLGHAPYNVNGEGGRPEKYTKEFIEKEADELLKWVKEGKFIWFEEFTEDREYNANLMSLWAQTNDRFSVAYNKAKEKQKNMLVKGGLLKDYQYNMCALLLGHSWGIVSKEEKKVSLDSKQTIMEQLADTSEIVDE